MTPRIDTIDTTETEFDTIVVAENVHRNGREVRDDLLRGKLVSRIGDRNPHPLPRLLHGRVGQAHDGEARTPRAHVYFNLDRPGIYAEQAQTAHPADGHQASTLPIDATRTTNRLLHSSYRACAVYCNFRVFV